MTSITTLEKFVTAAKDNVGEAFYSDTWRSTSYLIQLLNKMESYFESLNADDPESDYFTAREKRQQSKSECNESIDISQSSE